MGSNNLLLSGVILKTRQSKVHDSNPHLSFCCFEKVNFSVENWLQMVTKVLCPRFVNIGVKGAKIAVKCVWQFKQKGIILTFSPFIYW